MLMYTGGYEGAHRSFLRMDTKALPADSAAPGFTETPNYSCKEWGLDPIKHLC